MNMKKLLFTSLLAVSMAAVFTSCSEEQISLMNGVYSGSIIVSDDNGSENILTLTATLDNGRFEYSDDFNCNYGSGTYSVDGNHIYFNDTSEHPKQTVYLWWRLDGNYQYTFDGERLTLSRVLEGGSSHQFILTKSRVFHRN